MDVFEGVRAAGWWEEARIQRGGGGRLGCWALECVSGIGGRSQEVVGARTAGWWELLASWGKGRKCCLVGAVLSAALLHTKHEQLLPKRERTRDSVLCLHLSLHVFG